MNVHILMFPGSASPSRIIRRPSGISFQSLGLTHHLGKASALEGHDLAEAIKQILDDREALSRQRSNCAHYDMHVGTRDIVELVSTV